MGVTLLSEAMDVGIHFMNFNLSGGPEAIRGHIADTAEAAEAAGCSMFTFMDHYFQMEGFTRAEDPMLEGYAACGFVAGRTEKMTLGLLVTGVTYRHPGLLAKIATTLDVLSGGRAMLGLGAAWYEREHLALGVPFPPLKERFEHLEEALQICLQMWDDGNNGPYDGKHFQLAETLNVPTNVSRPRPKILVGGGGEKKTLRLVAKYADANNLFSSSPEQVAHKLDVLRAHCEREGRDPAEILNTTGARINPDLNVDEFVDLMRQYAEIGMQHVQLSLVMEEPARFVQDVVGPQIVPRLREL
jgi:F420-dependent oxidoreductase-like protein